MHSAHAPPVLRCVGAQQAPAWAAQLCCKITHIQLFFSVSIITTVDNSPVAHVRRPSGARPGVRGVYGSFVSPICPEKGREKGEVRYLDYCRHKTVTNRYEKLFTTSCTRGWGVQRRLVWVAGTMCAAYDAMLLTRWACGMVRVRSKYFETAGLRTAVDEGQFDDGMRI